MEKFENIGGTYHIKKTKTGNIILKNDNAKLTLKPEILKSLIWWAMENQACGRRLSECPYCNIEFPC